MLIQTNRARNITMHLHIVSAKMKMDVFGGVVVAFFYIDYWISNFFKVVYTYYTFYFIYVHRTRHNFHDLGKSLFVSVKEINEMAPKVIFFKWELFGCFFQMGI